MCFHPTRTDSLEAVFTHGSRCSIKYPRLALRHVFSFQTEKFATRGNSLNASRREILAPARTDLVSPRIAAVNSQTVDKTRAGRMQRGMATGVAVRENQPGL